MAINVTGLTTGGTTGGAPWTTASQSPTSNDWIFGEVCIEVFGGGTLPTGVTLSGNGLTWDVIDHVNFGTIATPQHSTWWFRAMGTASAGAVTISTSGGTSEREVTWAFLDVSGTDTSGSNGSGAVVQEIAQAFDGTNPSTYSITLAALSDATNNVVLSSWGNNQNSLSTAASGYTEINDLVSQGGANESGLEDQWKLPGTTTPGVTVATNFASVGGIGIEIKAAGGGAASTGWGRLIAGERNYVVSR